MESKINIQKKALFFIISAFMFVNFSFSANYFWVGGSGDWSDYANHWATSSGGTAYHTAAPSSSDNVYFDANSFSSAGDTVFLDVSGICQNMSWAGATNNPKFMGSNQLEVYGSLAFISAMQLDEFSGWISFYSDLPGNTINFGGHKLNLFSVDFYGNGEWTLMSDLDLSSMMGSISVFNGHLFTNGYELKIGFLQGGGMSDNVGIHLGNSDVLVTMGMWFMPPFDFDAGTSTITTQNNWFNGFGFTYHDVIIDAQNAGANVEIMGSNTFNNLIFTDSVSMITLESGSTQSVDNIDVGSGCANRVTIMPSMDQPAYIFKTAGNVYLDYLAVMNITILGGANFVSNNSIDLGNVNNWTINLPVPETYYWVGNGGNWNDPNHWALTSGGAPNGTCTPSILDTVYFDANSFSMPNQQVKIQGFAFCSNMDWTGIPANKPSLTNAGMGLDYLVISGSLTFDANLTNNFNGTMLFGSGRPGETITSKGVNYPGAVVFDGTGAYNLTDPFLCGSSVTIEEGTFNTNDQDFDCMSFVVSTDKNKTVQLGNSTVNVSWMWNIQDPDSLVFNAGTSEILFTGTDFYGGGLIYHDVAFNGASANIFGNNTFNTITISNSVLFESGNTQTFADLLASGNCTDYHNLFSTDEGQAANLECASGTINLDYVKLKDLNASGGATFNATNVISLGNVSGWNLTLKTPQVFYWVDDGGDWDDPAHWSNTSGGAPGSCLPTEFDTVIFDNNSFTLANQTVNLLNETNCHTFVYMSNDMMISLKGGGDLNIYGSFYINAFPQLNQFYSRIRFKSDSTGNNIFTSNRILNNKIYFEGKGEWNLQSELNTRNIGSNKYTMYFNEGTLNTNDHEINTFFFWSSSGKKRTLNLGNSILNLTGNWYCSNGDNLTINAGTSVINQSVAGSFQGGGQVYNEVNLSATGNYTIYGSNTFNALNLPNISSLMFEGGETQTITSLTVPNGTGCDDFMILKSSNSGVPAEISSASLNLNLDYYKITDVSASGGGTFNAANSIGSGEVSGWVFTPYPGKKYYWIGDGGDWNDPAHWSLSSGGSSTACLPTERDSVYFDANSFSTTDQEANINNDAACALMDWTGVTNMPKLNCWSTLTVNGSLILSSNMNADISGYIRFTSGNAGNIVDLAGHGVMALYFAGAGEYALNSNLNVMNEVQINSGTFNTNDYNITLAGFGGGTIASYGAAPRTINLGSSVINVDNWRIMDSNNLTLNAGSSTIEYSGQAWEFYGGHQHYNDIIIYPNMWGSPITISASNTFNTLEIKPGTILWLEDSTTQKATNFIASGEIGDHIYVKSTTDGARAAIAQTSGDFCSDYLILQDIEAAGSNDFYAGGNSIDLGNNAGWNFTNLTANNQYPFGCEDTEGSGTMSGQDLTALDNAVNGGSGYAVNWFEDSLLSFSVPDPSDVTANNGTKFYGEIALGACSSVATALYTVFSWPAAADVAPVECEDSPGSGSAAGIDLTALESSIAGGSASITWYEDAGLSAPVAAPTSTTVNDGDDFYAEVSDGNCTNVAMASYTVNSMPILNDQTEQVCEDAFGSGSKAGIDLTALEAAIDGGASLTFSWYEDAGLTVPVSDPANVTVAGGDDFYAEGDNGNCTDVAIVIFEVNALPVANDQHVELCEDSEGSGSASGQDLTVLEAVIDGGAGTTISWYEDAGLSTAVANAADVTVADGDVFYAEVDNDTCISIAAITYTVHSLPEANDLSPTLCEDSPGSGTVVGADLTATETLVNPGGAAINWYEDAGLSTAVGDPANVTINNGDDFYAEVDDGNCTNVATVVYAVSGSITANDQIEDVCEDSEGSATAGAVDLTVYDAAINGGSGISVDWYDDAGLSIAVGDPANVTISDADTFFVEMVAGTCSDDAVVEIMIRPLPSVADQNPVVCEDTLSTGKAYSVDLTAHENAINNGSVSFSWYEDAGLTTAVPDPVNATVSDGQAFYAKTDNGYCYQVATVTYTVNALPTALDQDIDLCETIKGGNLSLGYDLTSLDNTVDGGLGNTVTWYEDAGLETAVATPASIDIANNNGFFAEIDNGNCVDVARVLFMVNNIPNATDIFKTICENSPGSVIASGIDLTSYEPGINAGTGLTFTWYTDAALSIAVPDPTNAVVSNADVFYIDVNNGHCSDTAQADFSVGNTILVNDLALDICETVIGSYTADNYDLTQHDFEITGGGAGIVTWYEDAGLMNLVVNPTNFDLTGSDTLYTEVASGLCSSTAEVFYEVRDLPVFTLGADTIISTTSTLMLDPLVSYDSYFWNTGDTTATISIDAALLGTGDYEYWLRATNIYGCSNYDTIMVSVSNTIPVISKMLGENRVVVYPNPTSDMLYLKITGMKTTVGKAEILSVNGQLINAFKLQKQGENNVYQIDMGIYPKGMYFIRINAGNFTEMKKVILQ